MRAFLLLIFKKTGDRYGEDTFLDVTESSEKYTNNSLLMTYACIVKGVEHHKYGNKRFSKSLHNAIKSKEKPDSKLDDAMTNDIKDERSKSKK